MTFVLEAYLTPAQALEYFQKRLYSDNWYSSSIENRQAALIQATQLIDRLPLIGTKTESTQTLQFPRDPDTDVPQDVLMACCEIAYELLSGAQMNKDYEAINLAQATAGSIKSQRDMRAQPEHIVYGIPSYKAWYFLRNYLINRRDVVLSRVT